MDDAEWKKEIHDDIKWIRNELPQRIEKNIIEKLPCKERFKDIQDLERSVYNNHSHKISLHNTEIEVLKTKTGWKAKVWNAIGGAIVIGTTVGLYFLYVLLHGNLPVN